MIFQDWLLFILGIIFLIIASIKDLKTREISDWIPYSLIALGLTYKLFIALDFIKPSYFISNLFSFAIFVVLGYSLYYFKIFGGGDAKLLMAIGILIPSLSISEAFFNSLLFIAILFLCGAVWNLFASFKWKSIKKGRPFVPSFLFAFLICVCLWIKGITILTLFR